MPPVISSSVSESSRSRPPETYAIARTPSQRSSYPHAARSRGQPGGGRGVHRADQSGIGVQPGGGRVGAGGPSSPGRRWRSRHVAGRRSAHRRASRSPRRRATSRSGRCPGRGSASGRRRTRRRGSRREVEVLHRVVLGVHGEVVAARVAGQAARHRPGGQHPVVLQAQVPVQAAGVVLLDDEAGGAGVGAGRRRGSAGTGSGVRAASRRRRYSSSRSVTPAFSGKPDRPRWMPECPVRSAAEGAAG